MRYFILFIAVLSNMVWAGLDVQLQGPQVQGAMLLGKAPVGSEIMLDGKAVKQAQDGHFVLGFGRDAKEKHRLTIQFNGQQWQKTLYIQPRSYHLQKVQGVSNKLISNKKTEQEWQKIKQDADLIKLARQKTLPLLAFAKPFVWPIIGPITGVYGSQRIYNGVPGRPHYGVDVAAPVGAVVRAPNDGVVSVAAKMYYSGGTLALDHGYGISSTFLHLSKILVKVGDKVKQGDKIALVGQSGIATGPHLDWRLNWYLTRLDPELIVKDMNNLLKEQNK